MSFTQTRLKANFQTKSETHPRFARAVTLLLTESEAKAFAESYQKAAEEDREYSFFVETNVSQDETEKWFFIFKHWPNESRVILSHPEHPEWVITVALSPTHREKLFEALKSRRLIDVNKLEPIARVSNGQIHIEVT